MKNKTSQKRKQQGFCIYYMAAQTQYIIKFHVHTYVSVKNRQQLQQLWQLVES